MRISWRVRSTVLVAAAVAAVLFASGPVHAQGTKFVGRFNMTTVGLNPGAAIATKIDLLRWSTDEETAKLTDEFKKDPAKWADALQAAPSVGYIWTTSSSLGYSVKMARLVPLPAGGARIVLAIERVLGSWERAAWKGTGPAATDYPFTVIELRVSAAGIGTGKTSLAGKVAVDEAVKAPALENYATAPITLSAVKRTDAAAAPK